MIFKLRTALPQLTTHLWHLLTKFPHVSRSYQDFRSNEFFPNCSIFFQMSFIWRCRSPCASYVVSYCAETPCVRVYAKLMFSRNSGLMSLKFSSSFWLMYFHMYEFCCASHSEFDVVMPYTLSFLIFFVFMKQLLNFVFCVLFVMSHRICTTRLRWMYLAARNFLCPSHTVTLSDCLPPRPVHWNPVRLSVNHLDPALLRYVNPLTSPALSYVQ